MAAAMTQVSNNGAATDRSNCASRAAHSTRAHAARSARRSAEQSSVLQASLCSPIVSLNLHVRIRDCFAAPTGDARELGQRGGGRKQAPMCCYCAAAAAAAAVPILLVSSRPCSTTPPPPPQDQGIKAHPSDGGSHDDGVGPPGRGRRRRGEEGTRDRESSAAAAAGGRDALLLLQTGDLHDAAPRLRDQACVQCARCAGMKERDREPGRSERDVSSFTSECLALGAKTARAREASAGSSLCNSEPCAGSNVRELLLHGGHDVPNGCGILAAAAERDRLRDAPALRSVALQCHTRLSR